MNVRELIEILKKYDPDSEIVHNYDWGHEYFPMRESSIRVAGTPDCDDSVLVVEETKKPQRPLKKCGCKMLDAADLKTRSTIQQCPECKKQWNKFRRAQRKK